MQDEINTKVVALAIRGGTKTGKVTTKVLQAALRKFLAASKKQAGVSKTYQGKQTVSQLMRQNTGLTNIEITDQNIKSFERVAQKYNIDFALKKDKSVSPPRYLVFFKARDVDVMTAAFKEYTAKEMTKSKKPSIRKKLSRFMEQAAHRQREKVKSKDRGQAL